MDGWLARLERRYGTYAVENLTSVIVGGQGLAFALSYLSKGFENQLSLEPSLVMRGQVWRLVTYLFLPPANMSPLFAVFAIMITWTVGTGLEAAWGAFKFNLFYVFGALATTAAGWLAHGGVSNVFLNLSLFLAFATVYPDYEFRMFFFFPMKVKWLAFLDVMFLAYQAAEGDWAMRAAIMAAIANYLLFFSGTLFRRPRSSAFAGSAAATTSIGSARAVRRSEPAPALQTAGQAMGHRRCAICDLAEEDGADIRVCNCEKCGGVMRNLCVTHARAH